ncbi:MAG: ABC transporter permease, partial [Sciscionella sp.]
MASRGSGSLRTYLLVRLALVIPMVLILLTFVFVLMRVAPGDPIQAALGARLSPEQIAIRRHAAGYDKPLIVQYWHYLSQVFTGHFGTTVTDHRQVIDIVKTNGAATLELTVAALIVAVIVGLAVGLVAGRLRDSWFDVFGRLFGIVVYAAPVF